MWQDAHQDVPPGAVLGLNMPSWQAVLGCRTLQHGTIAALCGSPPVMIESTYAMQKCAVAFQSDCCQVAVTCTLSG